MVTQQLWKRTELGKIDSPIEEYNFPKFTQDKVVSQNSPNAIKEIKSEVKNVSKKQMKFRYLNRCLRPNSGLVISILYELSQQIEKEETLCY